MKFQPLCKTLLLLCLVASGTCSVEAAEESSRDAEETQKLHFDRLALIGGTGAVLHYAGFKYFDRAWYQGQKQDHIRWIRDWSGETYLNLDKGGHFMGGILMGQALTDAFTWSGFRPRPAALLGTFASWAALLQIEMRDAYFDQWGFSIPDFVANTVGASIPLIHTWFPRTQAIRFKASYHPSNLYLDRRQRTLDGRPRVDHLIDDYEGMTFWLTLSIEDFLPAPAASRWPDGLGLAWGYGATGLHGSNVKSKGPNKRYPDLPDASPEFFFALDYDARFLPGKGRFWSHVKKQLNWLHFPTPAVRFHPSWRFYLLYM